MFILYRNSSANIDLTPSHDNQNQTEIVLEYNIQFLDRRQIEFAKGAFTPSDSESPLKKAGKRTSNNSKDRLKSLAIPTSV